MNTEEKHTLIKTYALSERHKHCDTHTVTPPHTLRDLDIQRERLTDKERHKHTERQTQ